MKRTLMSLILAVVMVLSVFTNALAYTDLQKTDIISILQNNGFDASNVLNTTVDADVLSKAPGEPDFSNGPKMINYTGATQDVEYKASLDMSSVADEFNTLTTIVETLFSTNYSANYDALMVEFGNMPVTGDFTVKVEVPEGVVVPASFINTANTGVSADILSVLDETSRTITDNVVTIVFNVKDGVTKSTLDTHFAQPLDYSLVCNALTLPAIGSFEVKGSVEGNIYVHGASNYITIKYTAVDDLDELITIPAPSSQGGSYRPNAGAEIKGPGAFVVIEGVETDASDYIEDNKLDVSDLPIPEKEGAEFEDWYIDPEFTTPADDEIVIKDGEKIKLYPKFVSKQVPDEFDSSDNHYAYIIGYPDGTVRPEDDISREEIATIFYRLMTDEYRDSIASTTNDFSDVEETRWSNRAISTMANGGYIVGYNGKFEPEASITRAEFVTIAARFLDYEESTEVKFNDVEGHWAATYIAAVADALWISGYEDGSFRPDEFITRAEAMAIFNRILCRRVDSDGLIQGTVYFPDVSDTDWFVYDVLEATNSHKCEKADGEVYETWTELLPNRDWTKY